MLSHPIIRLIRLHQPVGTLLLLWPTLCALWLAAGQWPGWRLIAVMALGAFCMRSAGCAYNDRADYRLDRSVSRTADRPLATGELSDRIALLTAAVLVACAAGLVLLPGLQTALVAALGLGPAALYPYVKRHSNYPQLVLGVAFAWGVPVAWVAGGGEVNWAALLFFVGTWCWIVSYDTQYAMSDRSDDVLAGVGSTAIGFGPHERLVIALMQGGALLLWSSGIAMTGVGFTGSWGVVELSLALVAALFIHQLWIIRDRQPQACLRAFRSNALAGMALFAGIAWELAPHKGLF